MTKIKKLNYAKGNRTKKLVLSAALELIAEKGYENVTVNAICLKCNLTKGAFYHHFESKESIIDQMYVDADKDMEELIPDLIKKYPTIDLFSELSYLYAQKTVSRGVEIMKQKIRNNMVRTLRNTNKSDFYNPINRPLLTTFAEIYNDLQINGHVTTDYPFEHFFHFLIVNYDGVVLDWCYHMGSYDLPEAVLEITKRYVYSYKTLPLENECFKKRNT